MSDFELDLYDRLEVIKATVNQYGEENFYISFSGGKDSTVLHYMIDEALPNNKIPRVYMNTGIEFRDIFEHVKRLAKNDERIIILNSNVNITKMLKEEGYPFKSKFHSEMVRRYQSTQFNSSTVRNYYNGVKKDGATASAKFACPKKLKYQFSDDFKLKLSSHCCDRLKKEPLHNYEKENNKSISILGLRRAEGGIRSMHEGCIFKKNGKVVKFNPLNPLSDEFMEWYIESRNIQLSKLYYPPYNFDRTGCKGCPFALHLRDELNKLEESLPNERKQCEIIWKPVYDEYRRIGYRLKRVEQKKLFNDENNLVSQNLKRR